MGDNKLELEPAGARQAPGASTTTFERSTQQRLTLVSESAREAYDTRSLQFPGRTSVKPWRRRGWLVRRTLLGADLAGLTAAFFLSERLVSHTPGIDRVDPTSERVFFLLSLPIWVIVANLAGLYDRDGERTDHSTADDIVGVFDVVTVATWVAVCHGVDDHLVLPSRSSSWRSGRLAVVPRDPDRALRALTSRKLFYLQNTIIVGAGDVGSADRPEIPQSPGVRAQPRRTRRRAAEGAARRPWTSHAPWPAGGAAAAGSTFRRRASTTRFLERADREKLTLIRNLEMLNVQIDVVPRLFEIVGPKVGIHTSRVSRSSAFRPPASHESAQAKDHRRRAGDSRTHTHRPLFAYVAWRCRRDSPGPIFYRQTRLGINMRPFTISSSERCTSTQTTACIVITSARR